MGSQAGYEALGFNRGLYYYRRKPSNQILAVKFHNRRTVRALDPDAPTRGRAYDYALDKLYREAEAAGVYGEDWQLWHDMPSTMRELPETMVYRRNETIGQIAGERA